MEFREAVYNASGGVDCEINHPIYGWIPFTARYDDPHGADIYDLVKSVAAPYVEPDDSVIDTPEIPQVVSRYQARMAMLDAGILGDVEVAVQDSNSPSIVIAWQDASVWERTSPTIADIASALGMTDAELDALFIQAATYRA